MGADGTPEFCRTGARDSYDRETIEWGTAFVSGNKTPGSASELMCVAG